MNITLLPLTVGLQTLVIMLASLFLHEFGHILMAWRLGKETKIVWHLYNFEVEFESSGLSPEEKKSIYLAGIIAGFIPLLCFFMIPLPYGVSILLFLCGSLLHLQTCLYDMMRVRTMPGDTLQAALKVITPLQLFTIIALLSIVMMVRL